MQKTMALKLVTRRIDVMYPSFRSASSSLFPAVRMSNIVLKTVAILNNPNVNSCQYTCILIYCLWITFINKALHLHAAISLTFLRYIIGALIYSHGNYTFISIQWKFRNTHMRIIHYIERPFIFFRYLHEDILRTFWQCTLNQRRKILNFNYKHIKNIKREELCQIKHFL